MPAAEITREETRARARLLTVHGYDLDLDLARGASQFGSTATVRFACAEPGADTYIDLVADGGELRELVLNGTALDPAAHYADGRITLPGLAADNTLRVVADLPYQTDGTGLHRSVDPLDSKVYTYTKFEPDHARKVFACFEQPDLKAPLAITVTAPEHWTVIATQPTGQPEQLGDGAARWTFEPTPPLPTYLAHVTAGEYHLVRSTHTTPRGQVIPLGLGCRASLAEHLEAEEIFGITAAGLDYFTGLFDLDYPFAKYDQVFVPSFPSGAMENPASVSISEDLIFHSRATEIEYEVRAVSILHEMAHMWFGDYVTMQWWDDLWLNESFAEYAGTQAAAQVTKYTGAWTTFANTRKGWGYAQDQLPSTHPIAADVATLSEAMANFDGISYAKGAAVLKQLIAFLGEEVFFAGIRAYFAEHAWGNATLAHFLHALEEAGGRDLKEWSRLWLETAGPNTLSAQFDTDENGAFTSFAVLQEASADYPTLRPHHIAIGLYQRLAATLVRVVQVEVDVDGQTTAVPALLGRIRPDLILLNDGDLGYTLIKFDERSQATLTEAVGEFQDSLARSICLTSATNMMILGELSVPRFVRLAAAAAAAEPSVAVLQNLHQALTYNALSFVADPAWVPRGRAFLAEQAEELLRAAEPGSDHQLAWARLLAATATADTQLDLLEGLLAGTAELPGLAVDTELRWALLGRLAATGRAGDGQIEAELRRDPSDSGIRHAHATRAQVPDAAHKAAAWELLTGPASPDVQTIIAVCFAFRDPGHAELLRPYSARFFEILPQLWERRSGFARLLTPLFLMPTVDAGPALLARADAFLAEHEDGDPGLVRAVLEGRATIARAAASRALA
jgi:aminopeptidase N